MFFVFYEQMVVFDNVIKIMIIFIFVDIIDVIQYKVGFREVVVSIDRLID